MATAKKRIAPRKTVSKAKKSIKKQSSMSRAIKAKPATKIIRSTKKLPPVVTSVSIGKKPSFRFGDLQIFLQLIIATSAMTVLFLLGVVDHVTFSTVPGSAADARPVTINVEHTNPITLSVLIARKEQSGYVSLVNQSNENIFVSVPSDWKRTEVTGSPISAVTQDMLVFGFTRWALPAHTGMKMMMADAPTSLYFKGNSAATAAIDMQTVDLTTLRASSRVVLVQSGAVAQLWKSEE